jgi:hypothetical protein
MNKKILIGSIIAVAILVGLSLTSVVGYQSVESNLKESPLFNVRISSAKDKENNEDLYCEYIGKEIPSLIGYPIKDSKTDLIKRLFNIIRKIDDETFSIIIGSIIRNIEVNEDKIKIINELKLIKANPENYLISNWVNWNYQFRGTWEAPCTFGDYFPGCLIIKTITIIFVFLEMAIKIIFFPLSYWC